MRIRKHEPHPTLCCSRRRRLHSSLIQAIEEHATKGTSCHSSTSASPAPLRWHRPRARRQFRTTQRQSPAARRRRPGRRSRWQPRAAATRPRPGRPCSGWATARRRRRRRCCRPATAARRARRCASGRRRPSAGGARTAERRAGAPRGRWQMPRPTPPNPRAPSRSRAEFPRPPAPQACTRRPRRTWAAALSATRTRSAGARRPRAALRGHTLVCQHLALHDTLTPLPLPDALSRQTDGVLASPMRRLACRHARWLCRSLGGQLCTSGRTASAQQVERQAVRGACAPGRRPRGEISASHSSAPPAEPRSHASAWRLATAIKCCCHHMLGHPQL